MGKKGKGSKESKYINIGRISRSRRDGDEIKFKGYDGSKRTSKYAPCASIVAREFNGKFLFSVIFDDGFEVDKEEEFYNFYPADGLDLEVDADAILAAAAARKNGGGKSKKSRREDQEDEDTSDSDEDDDSSEEDGDNPFAE